MPPPLAPAGVSHQTVLRIEPDNARVASELVDVRRLEYEAAEAAKKQQAQATATATATTTATAAATSAAASPKVAGSSSSAASTASSPRAPSTPSGGATAAAGAAAATPPATGGAGTPTSASKRVDKTAAMAARAPKVAPSVPAQPKTGFDFEKDALSVLKYPAVLMKYLQVWQLGRGGCLCLCLDLCV